MRFSIKIALDQAGGRSHTAPLVHTAVASPPHRPPAAPRLPPVRRLGWGKAGVLETGKAFARRRSSRLGCCVFIASLEVEEAAEQLLAVVPAGVTLISPGR